MSRTGRSHSAESRLSKGGEERGDGAQLREREKNKYTDRANIIYIIRPLANISIRNCHKLSRLLFIFVIDINSLFYPQSCIK